MDCSSSIKLLSFRRTSSINLNKLKPSVEIWVNVVWWHLFLFESEDVFYFDTKRRIQPLSCCLLQDNKFYLWELQLGLNERHFIDANTTGGGQQRENWARLDLTNDIFRITGCHIHKAQLRCKNISAYARHATIHRVQSCQKTT